MKVLICSDKFKGSLSSAEVNLAIKKGISQANPQIICNSQSMSDGGDGFLDSIVTIKPITHSYPVIDNYGQTISTDILYANKTVYIELAKIIGIAHDAKSSFWDRSSFGLGKLISDILDSTLDISHIIVGLGGSSTNDGGFGVLAGLGIKFYTPNNQLITKFTHRQLLEVARLDMSNLHPKLNTVQIELIADVKRNLLGDHGCSYLFARQKGAASNDLAKLEAAISNLQRIILKSCKIDIAACKYGLCSGGIAAGLSILPNISCYDGAKWVIAAANLEKQIIAADCVVSGEGTVDKTTLYGKLLYEIGHLCQKHHKPLIIIAGQINCDLSKLQQIGITSAFSIIQKISPLEFLIENAPALISNQITNIFSWNKTIY